ncbi:MAG: hypothetical protein OXC18_05540 [Desulfurellaceae bacterium]|nr:hypothetical protein [Desulfurellaceae bacterium]
MKQITLDVSDEMFEAIKELSEITEPDTERDRIAKLLESSLRAYEWVIYQQLNGRKVMVLKAGNSEVLESIEGKSDFVSQFFPEDKKPLLEQYFSKAA